MNTALVSVVIPTHNRSSYAVSTIRALLVLSQEVEIVVCDTSDTDEISAAFATELLSTRVRILRPNKPLSVVDNFNEALKAASGQYLIFIGDDDFVSSEIVNVARWALNNEVEAIKFSFPAQYYWPDFRHHSKGATLGGSITIEDFDGSIHPHDGRHAAAEALQNFGGGVMEMPRAYAGMVSMNLVTRIIQKHGALFGGVSPDIYSALLISMEVRKCVRIDYPIIIPGSSGASTSGQSADRKHVGGLRNNAHIAPFKNLVWDTCIPEFYSVPTVWSYSLLKAIEKTGMPRGSANFARLYTKCFLYHTKYTSITGRTLAAFVHEFGLLHLVFGVLVSLLKESYWVGKKIKARVMIKLWGNTLRHSAFHLQNSTEASIYLTTYLKSKKAAIKYF